MWKLFQFLFRSVCANKTCLPNLELYMDTRLKEKLWSFKFLFKNKKSNRNKPGGCSWWVNIQLLNLILENDAELPSLLTTSCFVKAISCAHVLQRGSSWGLVSGRQRAASEKLTVIFWRTTQVFTRLQRWLVSTFIHTVYCTSGLMLVSVVSEIWNMF